MPLDAAIFATCGLEDDPALTRCAPAGCRSSRVEGPDVDGVPLIDIDDRGGIARARPATCTSWATAGSRPWRCRCASTARAARSTPARRARAHYRDVRHRIEGVEDVFGPVPVVETASNAVAEGALAGRTLLDVPADRRPTAVLAQSDMLAAGVLAAAAELGLRVPEDVSVTGFDGADLHWLAPTLLTTVVQPSEAKGRAAARGRDGAGRGRHRPGRAPARHAADRHDERPAADADSNGQR